MATEALGVMSLWLVFLIFITIINIYFMKRSRVVSLVVMLLVIAVSVMSLQAFEGDLDYLPFSLVVMNVIISVFALVNRY